MGNLKLYVNTLNIILLMIIVIEIQFFGENEFPDIEIVYSQSESESTLWQGQVVRMIPDSPVSGAAAIHVHVIGKINEPIEIRKGEIVLTGLSGSKVEYGPFASEFAPLSYGLWLVSVPNLRAEVAVEVNSTSTFVVEFVEVPIIQPTSTPTPTTTPTKTIVIPTETPSPSATLIPTFTPRPTYTLSATKTLIPTYTSNPPHVTLPMYFWKGKLFKNTSHSSHTNNQSSIIIVRVYKHMEKIITLQHSLEHKMTCETDQHYFCLFQGLSAGVYTINLTNPDGQYKLFVDGIGFARVDFTKHTRSIITPDITQIPIIGSGARQNLPTPTKTMKVYLPTATSKLIPTEVGTVSLPHIPTEVGTLITEMTPTFMPTVTATPTPTVAIIWIAEVLVNTSQPDKNLGAWSVLTIEMPGYGGVRVIIQSEGGFDTTCVTGTKPELGKAICQVGGLSAGLYKIFPQDIPIFIKVPLDGNGHAHVVFRQEYAP
ncbi:MAG: hypothetical protein B6242_10860 [Anaerolineaceae bacterium 4572_78]|nr:MAG: hypothetical protein B6242_10860 [Anaerolineaceae bacterium 4572_78]